MSKFNWRFTVPGIPVAKPRQTQSDRWKQRAPVVKYRAFADLLRLYAKYSNWEEKEGTRYSIDVDFYFPFPKGTSLRRQQEDAGAPHTVKPDTSNLLKAVEDALFLYDQAIWSVSASKRYDDGKGPRTEITIRWEEI